MIQHSSLSIDNVTPSLVLFADIFHTAVTKCIQEETAEFSILIREEVQRVGRDKVRVSSSSSAGFPSARSLSACIFMIDSWLGSIRLAAGLMYSKKVRNALSSTWLRGISKESVHLRYKSIRVFLSRPMPITSSLVFVPALASSPAPGSIVASVVALSVTLSLPVPPAVGSMECAFFKCRAIAPVPPLVL